MNKLPSFEIDRSALLKGIAMSVVIVLLGFLSGFSTTNEINNWYALLNKPSFNPPSYLFGPVWTLLYILMGVSFTVVLLQQPSQARKRAIFLFLFQFILNLCWSSLFFNLHLIGWAFAEIITLLFTILLMVISFYRINRIAGLLQIPYLLWVSFASLLNFYIYLLN